MILSLLLSLAMIPLVANLPTIPIRIVLPLSSMEGLVILPISGHDKEVPKYLVPIVSTASLRLVFMYSKEELLLVRTLQP